MNIIDAKKELNKIANGRYHSMTYTVSDHGNGRANQSCCVYLDKHGHFESPNWEGAIASLKAEIKGTPKISEGLPISSPT